MGVSIEVNDGEYRIPLGGVEIVIGISQTEVPSVGEPMKGRTPEWKKLRMEDSE